MSSKKIRLFISHSSTDVFFAKAIVELLRTALRLSAEEIRCTSVDGYRLAGGANTDEQLKIEVHEADAFVGVISSDSLRSLYVAFELGARWGAKLPLIPLLAPGATAGILGGPLAGLNALSGSSASQLHQLITDLGNLLEIAPENAATYVDQINAVLAVKPSATGPEENKVAPTSARNLQPLEENILLLISRVGNYRYGAASFTAELEQNETKIQYHLDRLMELGHIFDRLSTVHAPTYGLAPSGRAYLVENELIQ